MNHERIELTDTPISAAIKLADGNPGAITALMTLMQESPTIDPDSVWGPLGPLLSLDRMGIYGSHIWVLWKDVCGQSAINAETLFRSAQLGHISDSAVASAARSGESSFDFDALRAGVREQLPAFGGAISSATPT